MQNKKTKKTSEEEYVIARSESSSSIMKTNSERYIGGWWSRNNHETKEPKNMIKDKICQLLSDLDFNIETIVHINKKDVESYIGNIQATHETLKKWFYILHCFEIGESKITSTKES